MRELSHRARPPLAGAAPRLRSAATPPGRPPRGAASPTRCYDLRMPAPFTSPLAEGSPPTCWSASCATSASTPSPRATARGARARRAARPARGCSRRAARARARRRRARRQRLRLRDAAGEHGRGRPWSGCSRTWTRARTRPAPASSRSCTASTTAGRSSCRAAARCWTPAAMPVLGGKRGHDVVTSSGDTLLGADDKAGVAEIMAAVAHLAAHPELPRPTLRVGFTPDEEIGEGASLFDVEAFGAGCAYTLDGSQPGELQDETFSGVAVDIDRPRRRGPPGLGHGQARQRRAAGRAHPRRAAVGHAHAGDHRRARGLHPPLRGRAATPAGRWSA